MTGLDALDTLSRYLRSGQGLSLFLDYDGTLVPLGSRFMPAQPEAALLDLLRRLAQNPMIQIVILSGRSLSSLAALFPISELALAGLYGLEIQKDGQTLARGPTLAGLRPTLERVKFDWEQRAGTRPEVAIEDKGFSVALHADGLNPIEAAGLVQAARLAVAEWLPAKDFRFIGGGDYLEVAPAAADKGQAVEWFLDQSPRRGQLPVYFGDDANDDEAFASVQRRGGLAIGVGTRHRFRNAATVLISPVEVRDWLLRILVEAGTTIP